MPTQQQIDSTTQKFLDIHDITNDLVILKDGTTSLIITVDAMNFGLLAEEEQDSIMYAYAGLLNSLNYPIQILIKSQTKDVTGYLRLLKDQEDKTLDNTQRLRIMKYREFVSNLIRERNVLDKKFYVAIPAKPLELGLVPVSSVMPGQSQTDISSMDKTMVIEKAKSILEPKRDHLIAQFARIGLYSRQLETQEIIQMFYQSYNPEAFEGQTMGDSKTYTTPLVSASIEENNMDNQINPNQPAASTATTQSISPEQAVPQQPSAQTPAVSPQVVINESPINATPMTQVPTETNQNSSVSVNESLVPTGYIPTMMNNSTQPTTVSPQVVVNESPINTTPMTQTPTETTFQVPNNLPPTPPTPPAPALPNTNPGEVDNNVPQEVNIEIEHPSEKDNLSQTQVVTNQGTDAVMPPLPEIK